MTQCYIKIIITFSLSWVVRQAAIEMQADAASHSAAVLPVVRRPAQHTDQPLSDLLIHRCVRSAAAHGLIYIAISK